MTPRRTASKFGRRRLYVPRPKQFTWALSRLSAGSRGLHVASEYPSAVYYDGVVVGGYRADLLIERRLIVEAKACPFHETHGKQLLTYLRCSDVELGIVISFDPKPHVRRFIMRNAVKGAWRRDRDRRVDAETVAEDAETTLK